MADKSFLTGGSYPDVNAISMDIGKSFAKVSLAYTETDGKLSEVEYRLANDPVRTYLLPNIFNNQVHTPHYEEDVNLTNFDEYFSNHFHPNSKVAKTENEDSDPEEKDPETGLTHFNNYSWRAASTKEAKTFAYCLENGNKTPLQGNSTVVLVKAKYTPEAWLNPNGSPGTKSQDGTFWRLKNENGYVEGYYNAKPDSYLTGTKTPVEYKGGISYYPIWLETDNKYMVKRNHYYKIAITNVKSAGAPSLHGDEIMVRTAPLTNNSTSLSQSRSVSNENNLPEAATSIEWEQNN